MNQQQWKQQIDAKCAQIVSGYQELNTVIDSIDLVDDVTDPDELAAYMFIKLNAMNTQAAKALE